MSFLKLCNGDPLVTTVRDLFDATPVRIPEERVQPLCVVASNGSKSFFLGALNFLLEGEANLNIVPDHSQMADVAGRRSRRVNLDLGLEVLEGFLKGFGIPSAGIASKFEGASAVSFSFKNVRRSYIETTRLGRLLSPRKVDVQNPAASIFRGGVAYDFLIIDSVISSSDFTINVDRVRDQAFKLDVPAIQSMLAQAKVGIQVTTSTGFDLIFQGDKHLTFAFSCVRFFLDEKGVITSIEPGTETPPLGFGPAHLTLYSPDRVLLSEEPGLLSWDTEE